MSDPTHARDHRTPIVGGNWKMNTNRASGTALATDIAQGVNSDTTAQVVVFPPFPYLLPISEALAGSSVLLGAQDCYPEADGAYTGEVSLAMLKDCHVSVVLTGHSERRHVIGESDALINAKTRAVLAAGLGCILCIGETLDQREAGQTDAINEAQLRAGLAGVEAAQMGRVVIAYEPVWAIGTGKVATPEDAQHAHAQIRRVLQDMYDESIAQACRIQYGGSVKPANAAQLFAQPDIDGGLIGGASLKSADFLAIIDATCSSRSTSS